MTLISQSIKNNALYGDYLGDVESMILWAFCMSVEDAFEWNAADQIHQDTFKLFVSEALND